MSKLSKLRRIIALTIAATLVAAIPVYADTTETVQASETQSTQEQTLEEQSTAVQAPNVQAEAAILIDASTGKVLYEKNPDEQLYPASITKMMTALLVIERCNLDDKVTFSKIATTNLEAGAVTLNLTEGDVISVRDCLYGLLLKSANEVANGLAEHVGGTVAGFSAMMNTRAKELGCTNTNFVNPNGLNDTKHLTTARDMALIAKACFANETFRQINNTLTYTFPATIKNKNTTAISIGHKMLYPSDARYYEGVFGGKTGYTSKAWNTLVTGATKDGITLIAVVLKAKQTQYTDTRALLDYGFAIDKAATDAANATEAASEAATESQTATAAGTGTNTGDDSLVSVGVGPGMKGWVMINNKWYYYDDGGNMLKNTTTPDGYRVDSEGVWVE